MNKKITLFSAGTALILVGLFYISSPAVAGTVCVERQNTEGIGGVQCLAGETLESGWCTTTGDCAYVESSRAWYPRGWLCSGGASRGCAAIIVAHANCCAVATVPGAPIIGTASAGNAQATVTFTAPSSDGGSPITSYTVTSNPGGLTGTGSASPITVTGLTNGTTYTFTVAAINAAGTGPFSSASNSVTPSAPATSFISVNFTLSPTTRSITNPLTGKVTTQTVVPDYTCTPYKVISAWEGQFVYSINYGSTFSTKEDAINATLTSLKNCLNIAQGPEIGTSANYVGTIIGGFRTQNYNPAWAAYNNNFTTKSACATRPDSLSYLYVSNANTCTLSGSTYNGSSRQVDYASYLPETIHLRSLWCYNSTLSGCTIKDAVVPTYNYSGNFNLQISSIDGGFKLTWTDFSAAVGAAVSYDVLKGDGLGSYGTHLTNPMITENSFTDAHPDPTKIQYYKVVAYNSNNSFIGEALVDTSSLLPIGNIPVDYIKGAGFYSSMMDSAVISMTNNSEDPNFIIPCEGFKYQDSDTLVNGICNVANAPSGVYDVLLKIGNNTYTLSKGFTLTYPIPTAFTVNILPGSNVSDGLLKINSVQGDLYTGAIIGVKVGDTKGSHTFTLVNFNPVTKSFCADVACTAGNLIEFDISDAMKLANGDLSKIQIFAANDRGSLSAVYSDANRNPLSLSDLGLGCIHNSDTATWIQNWTPAIDRTCPLNSSTAVDNCGVVMSTPGTLSCDPITQSCNVVMNQCVCKPKTKSEACGPNKPCGMASDGCGGLISCSNYNNGSCGPYGSGECGDVNNGNNLCDRDNNDCINSTNTKCFPCTYNGFGYDKVDGECP